MNKEELKKILDDHLNWLNGSITGKCANLIGAYLSGANLRHAYLSGANLPNYLPVSDISKWHILISKIDIKIGCQTKSYGEWDEFFKNKKHFETNPNRPEYELIYQSYLYAKGVKKFYMTKYAKEWGVE